MSADFLFLCKVRPEILNWDSISSDHPTLGSNIALSFSVCFVMFCILWRCFCIMHNVIVDSLGKTVVDLYNTCSVFMKLQYSKPNLQMNKEESESE